MKTKLRITIGLVRESVWKLVNDATADAANQRAAAFIALQAAQSDCTPRGRLRSQALRNRLGMVVASTRPQHEAQHYAI